MAATYPLDKLPPPVRDGYRTALQATPKKREMDDGSTKTRRVFDSQPFNHNLQFNFTWDQYSIFEAFLEYDCGGGTQYFLMPIVPGEQPRELRFAGYPNAKYNRGTNRWEVSGIVEQKDQGVPTGVRLAYADPDYVDPDYWDEIDPVLINGYPAFPAELPEPERDEYGINPNDYFVRSNASDGQAAERVRFKDRVANVSYKWILTLEQKAIFEDFLYNTLYGGYAPFYAPFANGEGVTTIRAKFAELPVISSLGAAFTVSATLECATIPRMAESEYRGL